MGTVKTYRTRRGDFRYDETHAKRLGLMVDGDTLPRSIARDVTAAGGNVEGLEAGYAKASNRQAILDELNAVPASGLAAKAAELAAGKAAPPPPSSTSDDETPAVDADLVGGTIGKVLDRIGDDPELAAEAIEAEVNGKARTSLLGALHEIVEAGE